MQAYFLDPHVPPVLVSPRFGGRNNVHVSCMKVWADHQGLSEGEETEGFTSLRSLQVKKAAKLLTAAEREKQDRHLGVLCHSCRLCVSTKQVATLTKSE